jgi:hypothetical protein
MAMAITKIKAKQLELTLTDILALDKQKVGGSVREMIAGLNEKLRLGAMSNIMDVIAEFDGSGYIVFKNSHTNNQIFFDINNQKITINTDPLLRSAIAGVGISVSKSGDTITITNTDRGSAQNIFKNIKVGTSTATASSNNDTFEFIAGAGISLSLNTTSKQLTIGMTLSAGTGISISGNTISLSTPNYFKDIANSSGTTQFTAGLGDKLQFGTSGDLSVSFDATNKRVSYGLTINVGTDLSKSGSAGSITISLTSNVARLNTAQTWTALQTFNYGIAMPDSSKGASNILRYFDLTATTGSNPLIVPLVQYTGTSQGVNGYGTWNTSANTGFKVNVANTDQLVVILNGVILRRGSVDATSKNIVNGDYVLFTVGTNEYAIVFAENVAMGDSVYLFGVFNPIFV